MDYPWYQTTSEDHLEQGELIPDCPIIKPPSKIEEGEVHETEIIVADAIILSQSCDLIAKKIEIVLVCPFYTVKFLLENLPEDSFKSPIKKQKYIDQIRKGYHPSLHLLNKDDQNALVDDFLVVDFTNVYGVDLSHLMNYSKQLGIRVKLLPPYREHLSQAFARYFMRVGLPQDLSLDGYFK